MSNLDTESDESVSRVPPPPPPLLPLLLSKKQFQPANSSVDTQDKVKSLEKAIIRVTCAEKVLHPKPFYTYYSHLQSQLQEGPKCGLVALSIATSKTNNFIPVDELYKEALIRGYTSQGEMYSCKNLADLIESKTDFKTFIICNGINSHIDCIFHCLLDGGAILVPYDADRNHSPCNKRGHSAHWAVLSGVVIFRAVDGEEEEDEDAVVIDSQPFEPCNCIETNRRQFFAKDGSNLREIQIIRTKGNTVVVKHGRTPKIVKRGKIYLAGKQGKSRNLMLWPLEALVASNNNMMELSEQQRSRKFTLPEGGVAEGLMGQAILLKQSDSS